MAEKDKAKTAAARLLGRLSAKSATPAERKRRAAAGGEASQAKYTPAQRSARGKAAAEARWEKERADKASQQSRDNHVKE